MTEILEINKLVVLDDWPKPDSVEGGSIRANDYRLLLSYRTKEDRFAAITFKAKIFKFGAPNDEALGGHPLFARGMRWYEVYRVENSTWVESLEEQNRVHPRHDAKMFDSCVHYIFTFKGSTFECVVSSEKYFPTKIQICSATEEIERIWRTLES